MTLSERCPSIGPDGMQCGMDAGHTGRHTALIPTGAKWQDALEELELLRPPTLSWVVWSMEHDAFWAPDERGYVTDVQDAGYYSMDDARRIVNMSHDGRCIAIPVSRSPNVASQNFPVFVQSIAKVTTT